MAKGTNYDLQNITHKTKDWVTGTPLKTGGDSGAPEWWAVPDSLVINSSDIFVLILIWSLFFVYIFTATKTFAVVSQLSIIRGIAINARDHGDAMVPIRGHGMYILHTCLKQIMNKRKSCLIKSLISNLLRMTHF